MARFSKSKTSRRGGGRYGTRVIDINGWGTPVRGGARKLKRTQRRQRGGYVYELPCLMGDTNCQSSLAGGARKLKRTCRRGGYTKHAVPREYII